MIIRNKAALVAAAAWAIAGGQAHAQATANAVADADDAFGFTSGDESLGIYDESSVRGFNLEAAGNYRMDGDYFVKNSGTSAFFIESTSVRIGYSTLNVVLPGPSGVVDFRLRDPSRGEAQQITIGLDAFQSPFLYLFYQHRNPDKTLLASIGASFGFDANNAQGGDARTRLFAGTARFAPDPDTDIRVFAGEYDYRRDGEFRVLNSGPVMPGRIARQQFLGQDWARERGQRRIAGSLIDHRVGNGLSFGATLIFSQEDPTRAYRQLIRIDGTDDTAHNSIVASPQHRTTSWSGEVRASLADKAGDFSYTLDLRGRGRRSRSLFGGDSIIALTDSRFGTRPEQIAAPQLDTTANLHSAVDQRGAGAALRGDHAGKLFVNLGLLKTHYTKRFIPGAGVVQQGVSSPWLYNLVGAWRIAGAEVYASYSRGLEEAGVAPATAANRNAVLDAIIVTQRELGMRFTPSKRISAIVAAFDIRKPYAGIDPNMVYRAVGDVRHRGVEASLSGKAAPGTTIVIGGVNLDPRLSGDLAEAGILGLRPAAVPRWRGTFNIDQAVALLPGFNVDLRGEYIGRQVARTAITTAQPDQLTIKPCFTIDLGARYQFSIASKPVTLRAQVYNLFNRFAWETNVAEALTYIPSRRLRLVLTSAI